MVFVVVQLDSVHSENALKRDPSVDEMSLLLLIVA